MKLFYSATIAVSMALMVSLDSVSEMPPPPPSLTNSHPAFSVTDDRTLNLRGAGSQIVIDTIENALR